MRQDIDNEIPESIYDKPDKNPFDKSINDKRDDGGEDSALFNILPTFDHIIHIRSGKRRNTPEIETLQLASISHEVNSMSIIKSLMIRRFILSSP